MFGIFFQAYISGGAVSLSLERQLLQYFSEHSVPVYSLIFFGTYLLIQCTEE